MRDRDPLKLGQLTCVCTALVMPLLATSASVSAQELRGWDHGDYGRVVFEWGQEVDHRLDQVSNRVINLTFSEPLSSGFSTVPSPLAPYVDSISRIDAETIQLSLSQSAEAAAFGTGTAVILDIRPTSDDTDADDPAPLASDASLITPSTITPSSSQMPNNPSGGTEESRADLSEQSQVPPDLAQAQSSQDTPAQNTPSQNTPAQDTGPGSSAIPAPPTETGPAEAAPTETVRVRGGVHDAYDRLVFDWQQPTEFTVHQDGQRARISFERPGRLDQSGLDNRNLDRLQSVTPASRDDGLVVDLTLRPETRIESFTIDNRAVFDIRDGTPPDDSIPEIPLVTESPDETESAAANGGDDINPQAPSPSTTDTQETESAETADMAASEEELAFRPRPSPPRPSTPDTLAPDPLAPDRLAPDRLAPESSSPPVSERTDELEQTEEVEQAEELEPADDQTSEPGRQPSGALATDTADADVVEPDGSSDDRPDPRPQRPAPPDTEDAGQNVSNVDDDDLPSLDDVSSSIEDTLARLESGPRNRNRTDPENQGGGRTAQSARSGYGTVPRESLDVRTLDVPEGPTVEFDPGVSTYAAFFLREGALWAVFASGNRLNTSELARDGEPVLGPPQAVEATGGVALRFADVNANALHVRRDNTAWSVTLVDDHRSVDVPISLLRQPNHPDGGRVLAMAPGARGVVRLQDPDIGDVLLVAPVAQAGVGMPTAREFAQLEFLKAATGIAVRPKADDILMSLATDGVALTADSGLVLSPDVDTRLAAASRPGEGVPRFFDFEDWTLPDRTLSEQRRELERRVVESQDNEKAAVRMELARLNLANAFPQETIGMLALAADAEPDIAQDPLFLALRGAARALAGDLDGASADLDDDAFVNAAEGYVWRGLVAEKRGDYESATRAYSQAGDVWSDFPDDLQIELRMSAARAALQSGDIETGHEIADDLLDDYGDRVSDSGAFQYLTGLIAKERGDGERAVAWFGEAADNNDRKHAVLSERELVALQVEREEIDPQDAADRLEQLRYAWRGDHLEFELLEDLGEAYWRDGSIREALVTWDDATQQFSELPAAEQLEDQLRSRFVQIFVGEDGAAADVDPIARYALYEDFRHLVPAGEIGRDIRLSLAEGLAEIDLLGRSAMMLEDILADGLPSDEIAEVATRLAGLRLLDNRLEDALDATDLALNSDPSAETAARARALRARALSEIDRTNEAFQTIAQDEGDLADATRLDIAWRAQDWGRAADALWSLVDRSDLDDGSLDAEWRNRLMNLTLVLALSDDEAGLEEVTERFGERLSNGPQGEAFRVLTRTGDAMDSLNLQSIRDEVDEVELFQSFLEGFREPDGAENTPVMN